MDPLEDGISSVHEPRVMRRCGDDAEDVGEGGTWPGRKRETEKEGKREGKGNEVRLSRWPEVADL